MKLEMSFFSSPALGSNFFIFLFFAKQLSFTVNALANGVRKINLNNTA